SEAGTLNKSGCGERREIGRGRKASCPGPNRIERFDPKGTKTPTGSGDSRRYRECWTGDQATGLSDEAARAGRIRGGRWSERPYESGRQFSRVSKQQAGNVDLGMVVRRADSRSERAKGRCEKPALDRCTSWRTW